MNKKSFSRVCCVWPIDGTLTTTTTTPSQSGSESNDEEGVLEFEIAYDAVQPVCLYATLRALPLFSLSSQYISEDEAKKGKFVAAPISMSTPQMN